LTQVAESRAGLCPILCLMEATWHGQVAQTGQTGQVFQAALSEQGEEQTCAICFEPQPFITVPCACKVDYCAACWDRALTSSAKARGHPSCPSCRQPFRVDYSTVAGGMIVSMTSESSAQAGEWRRNLYLKVRLAQIQLLRKHGTSISTVSFAARQLAHPFSVQQATGSDFQPQCVCGGHLELSCRLGRLLRMLDDTDPDWRAQGGEAKGALRRLLETAIVTCDICEGEAPSGVWTCSNGPHTLLHSEGNDVCERCFQHYVGHTKPERMPSCTPGARVITPSCHPGCYCQTGTKVSSPAGFDVVAGCTVGPPEDSVRRLVHVVA